MTLRTLSMVLGVLFIGLRLTHAIAWPWPAVLSPFAFTPALWLLGALLKQIAWWCMTEEERKRVRIAREFEKLARSMER